MCLQPRGGPRPGRRTSCSESLLADPHVWMWGLEIGCFLSFSWLSFLKLAGSFWSTARCGNHSLNKQKKLMRFRGQLSGQKRIVPGGESAALRGVPRDDAGRLRTKPPWGTLCRGSPVWRSGSPRCPPGKVTVPSAVGLPTPAHALLSSDSSSKVSERDIRSLQKLAHKIYDNLVDSEICKMSLYLTTA